MDFHASSDDQITFMFKEYLRHTTFVKFVLIREILNKRIEYFLNVVEHLFRQSGICSQEESVVHDIISVVEMIGYTPVLVYKAWLFGDVPGKEVAGLD